MLATGLELVTIAQQRRQILNVLFEFVVLASASASAAGIGIIGGEGLLLLLRRLLLLLW